MTNTDNKSAWYLSVPAVLVLLFFVLGPFALPLLYKSQNFSYGQKIMLTIVMLIFIIAMFQVVYTMINQLFSQMDQIDEMLKHLK